MTERAPSSHSCPLEVAGVLAARVSARLEGAPPPEPAGSPGRVGVTRFAERLCAATGRDADGAALLRSAVRLSRSDLDVLGYAMGHARDARSSLSVAARFGSQLLCCCSMGLDVDRGSAVFWAEVPAGLEAVAAPVVELFFGLVLRVAGVDLADRAPLRALRLRWQHSLRTEEAIAQMAFADVVESGRERSEVHVPRAWLDRELPDADLYLFHLLERELERRAADLAARDLRRRVRSAVMVLLGDRSPSLRQVAKQLGMSERTLQRRLDELGTSFSHELSAARRDLALAHLSNPERTVAEVADELGFATPGAFARAFKKWTGRRPSEARP